MTNDRTAGRWATFLVGLASLTSLSAAACRSGDNSDDTDRARAALGSAQGQVRESRDVLAANEQAIVTQKRELARGAQELADRQAALAPQRQQLGTSQDTLELARATYAAAVRERMAKLEATVATLATRTDAASKDAGAGLRARAAALAQKLATPPASTLAGWTDYTKDVDTTFDAIERDLTIALR
jgi:chromosome segregation ATPase